jgi:hypothetical protein
VHVSLGFLITCFGRRLGFTEASDIAPLALLLLLLPARERLPAMGGGRAAGLR